VAQLLLKKKLGGRVAAFEVLRGSAALSNAIRDGKTAIITNLIQTGKAQGMIGMDQSLADLVADDVVDIEEAYEQALDKEQFRSLCQKRRVLKGSAAAAPAVKGPSTTAMPAARPSAPGAPAVN
jgi:Tfp pilus assembly pilus retraction ATPase PilT